MKITLIGPVYPYRGGIAHFTTLLAKKLSETGNELQVISFKKQYPAWLYPGESDKDYSPSRVKVPAEYLLTPLNPLSWRKTARAIASFHPQQVIIPWWVTFWGPAFHHIITYLKKREIYITVLIHNTLPHEPRPWDRFLARRTLRGGDRFIVMTEKEKGRLLDLLPNIEKVMIVPHPIYRMFQPSPYKKDEIRATLGLPANHPVVLFFGFIRPYKGLGILLEAIKIILTTGRNIHLLIAGEFWDSRDSYDQQIKSLDLTDHVHIIEKYIPDDEAAQYFQAADLFTAPYTGGTQSGSLKSALGFGLPAVVTDKIADELVLHLPELCKIVPSGDPDQLAKAILHQLSVPRLAQSQIEALFDRSWEAMIAPLSKDLRDLEE